MGKDKIQGTRVGIFSGNMCPPTAEDSSLAKREFIERSSGLQRVPSPSLIRSCLGRVDEITQGHAHYGKIRNGEFPEYFAEMQQIKAEQGLDHYPLFLKFPDRFKLK
ncbi:hypothetical protein HOD75_01435 [archaeon]|nr:hypothetical protein [archaeon]MBT4241540.1 hypothetical protein [archaeon]MBT4417588.1 hypothetical protein [archaeon]